MIVEEMRENASGEGKEEMGGENEKTVGEEKKLTERYQPFFLALSH